MKAGMQTNYARLLTDNFPHTLAQYITISHPVIDLRPAGFDSEASA
jgi:hypothetical protein